MSSYQIYIGPDRQKFLTNRKEKNFTEKKYNGNEFFFFYNL